MKVAIFVENCVNQGTVNHANGEIVILAIKGRGLGPENIDGYDDYFVKGGRDVHKYNVIYAHIGSGDGIVLEPTTSFFIDGNNEDISHLFYREDEM